MNEPVNCDNSSRSTLNHHKNFKKSKRKRRKNKGVNYSHLKKKNHKKFHKFILPESHPQSQKINFSNKTVMSNWYWSNYKKAIEWQNKHQIAHWKSCALALQEENKYLLQIINNINPDLCPQLSATHKNLFQKIKKPKKQSKVVHSEEPTTSKNCSNVERNCEDEYEFEMSEEMMEFFEQSFKHKMDLKKLKDEIQSKNQEEEVSKIQMSKAKRTEEMQVLYGEGASMIIGMETAVQLSFDKYCDIKSPKYWPNIPLKL